MRAEPIASIGILQKTSILICAPTHLHPLDVPIVNHAHYPEDHKHGTTEAKNHAVMTHKEKRGQAGQEAGKIGLIVANCSLTDRCQVLLHQGLPQNICRIPSALFNTHMCSAEHTICIN
jgi:hypothetical protein